MPAQKRGRFTSDLWQQLHFTLYLDPSRDSHLKAAVSRILTDFWTAKILY